MHIVQLTANTREDYDLKFKMLHDTLDVVDMEGKLKGDESTVGGYDLIWADGPVPGREDRIYESMLGADFDKELSSTRVHTPALLGDAASQRSGTSGSGSTNPRRGGGGGGGGRRSAPARGAASGAGGR